MVLLIWNILIFDWITSRLPGSALSSAALRVPLHILSSFINNHCRRRRRHGLGLNHLGALIGWKKKNVNLYLNLFINLLPVAGCSVLTYVITSLPFAGCNCRWCKENISCTISVPQQEGQNDCQEASVRRGGDNHCACCSSPISFFFSFLPRPQEHPFFPYVNVTMLPYRPHNIHLLVEMPQHQHHCASIHRRGCGAPKKKKGSRGTVLFQGEVFLCCTA